MTSHGFSILPSLFLQMIQQQLEVSLNRCESRDHNDLRSFGDTCEEGFALNASDQLLVMPLGLVEDVILTEL